ncbi:hypothetical protein FQA39_LY15575 [Lamprigera yunnana]|nr:hypothetical protein FQA39_LY15575 [Lamprigera yunnana]
MTKEFWKKKTSLETGLILVLCTAVPFLVVMISVYIVGSFQKYPSHSNICLNYCSKKERSLYKVRGINPTVLEDVNDKPSVCDPTIFGTIQNSSNYKYFVAVLETNHHDHFVTEKYLCTSVIINSKWVIGGAKCLANRTESTEAFLFVRAGPEYWSSASVTIEVNRIIHHKKVIIAIELVSSLPLSEKMQPIALKRTSLFRDHEIAQIYYLTPRSNRTQALIQMQAIPVVIITNEECMEATLSPDVRCLTEFRAEKCESGTGFILIQMEKLMGFEIYNICKDDTYNPFHYVYDISPLLPWIKKTVHDVIIED